MLAGKIDVQFRVKGSKGKFSPRACTVLVQASLPRYFFAAGGTAAFTSVRRGKEGRFEVLRWTLTRDDGQVLDLRTSDPRSVEGLGSSSLG